MWANDLAVMMSPSSPSYSLKLAKMTGADSCDVGGMVLQRGNLLIAEHLTKTLPAEDGTYIEALKAGDTVLVCQLSDEKFVIIGRVV